MDLDLNLGDDMHMRALVGEDAALLVEATRGESAPSLWGPRPAGPYSLHDGQAALSAWDPAAGGQFSIGILRARRLLGAVGVMPDRPGSTELAYWIRPQDRGRGIASRAVHATTVWVHRNLAIPGSGWRSAPATSRRSASPGMLATSSNGAFPGTAATGRVRTPNTIRGTTA